MKDKLLAAAKGADPEFGKDRKFMIPINSPSFYGWRGMVGRKRESRF